MSAPDETTPGAFGGAGDPPERLIRLARLPDDLRPVPIWSADPAEPIPCEWLGISYVPGGGPASDLATFILYFLDGRGVPLEFLQYETLRIALDQAHAICGFHPRRWTACDLPVLDDGSCNVRELESALRA